MHVVCTCVSECGPVFIKTNQKLNICLSSGRMASEHTTAAPSNSAKVTRGATMLHTRVHGPPGGNVSPAGSQGRWWDDIAAQFFQILPLKSGLKAV